MSGKQLCLHDLPEATSTASNPTRAYLFGMNQHSVQLYLRDSSVPFESMMAAVNSSVPPTHSAATLMYLGPLQAAARLHLGNPANYCSYYSAEKSKTLFHIPDDAALRPIDATHALLQLKPCKYFHSVCPSGLDLSSRTIDLPCSAIFALALPQSVKPAQSSRSAEARKPFCLEHCIDPSSRRTSAATYTGSTNFADDPNTCKAVFGADPLVSVLGHKSLVSIDASIVLQQFFKHLFWYLYLHTISLSYTGASAFIANSDLYTTKLGDSVSEIIAALRLLSIGQPLYYLVFQMPLPHVLFEDALVLIHALPPSSPDTVNENFLYLLYLGLTTIIQQKMEANNYIRPVQSPSDPLALLTAFSKLQSACIIAFATLRTEQAQMLTISHQLHPRPPPSPLRLSLRQPPHFPLFLFAFRKLKPPLLIINLPQPLGWKRGMNPGPPPPSWHGCGYCFGPDHIFSRCLFRSKPHAVNFFHAYINEFLPEVYATLSARKPLASIPYCLPAPMTALVPSPAKKPWFGPSPYAHTYVTQIVHFFESAMISPALLNPMPLTFSSRLPHLILQLFPGVTVPVLYDTCSGVNLISSAIFLWLQYIAPSATLTVYDSKDSRYLCAHPR